MQKKDLLTLIRAIEEINEIATYLFALDNSREDFINFGKHFRNLEEFLKQRELALANEQERALISDLQLRLDKIKPENSTFSGTFRDLQEGLYYYLKQKNDEDQGVDWIVKNYEQIDGDILQSKRQFEKEQRKVYHFACVSDRDMNMSVNDQLPWPLTDEFIRAAYSPIDLQFQVYYTALGERSNFLRYALFYGLCYNRCDVRLSYVRQYGDETTEPYALLSILGLLPKADLIERVNKPVPFSISVGQDVTKGIKYDRYQMMDMFLCPYRFFLDYVMEDGPVIQGNFLYQKYFENLLIEAVWKRIGKQNRSDVMKFLPQILAQETQKLEPYFKFWKSTEILDLRARAKNYLVHEIITEDHGTTLIPFPLPGIVADKPCDPVPGLPHSAAQGVVVTELFLRPDLVLLRTPLKPVSNGGKRAGSQTLCFQCQAVAVAVHLFHHRDGRHTVGAKPFVHSFKELIGVGMFRPGIRKGDKVNGNPVLMKPN